MKNDIMYKKQIIIYRELPINRKLEVKVFDDYEKCNEFLSDFLKDKEEYIYNKYPIYDPRGERDMNKAKEEEERIMTPWQNIDFVEFERVEIGGCKIGYRG